METRRLRRNTQQRQVILEELRGLTSHPTAAELYGNVRQRLPKISLGTVYRNLELLSEMGTIQKLGISGPEARFDRDTGHHHHIRCVRCGRVDDLRDVPDDLTDSLAGGSFSHPSGYEILGYHLEFSGICPGCRAQQ